MLNIIWHSSSKEVRTSRWIARVLGAVPCFFVLIYFSGSIEDLKLALETGIDAEIIIPILTILATGIVGYIVSWSNELYGGVIMTAAGIITGVYLLYLLGWENREGMFSYSLPFIASGIAALISWRKDRKAG